MPAYAKHIIGVAGCSAIAFLGWVFASGVAFSPIVARSDDLPRTEAGFTFFGKLCGLISDGMLYPFFWVMPKSYLDGPQGFVLLSVFWGGLLYLLIYASLKTVQATRI